jgi:hypothetical protein
MSTVGEEREERGREERKGERNSDFNALLIHFNSLTLASKLRGD